MISQLISSKINTKLHTAKRQPDSKDTNTNQQIIQQAKMLNY
jgi:hypothetical protein